MTTLSEALTAYRICAKAEAKSEGTIRFVTQGVTYFANFLGGDPDIGSITPDDLRRFIIGLQQRQGKWLDSPYNRPQPGKLSPHSVATYARAVKTFFSYLHREDFIDCNPMEKVKLPKTPKNVVPTFSDKQLEMLLSQVDKNTNEGFRGYAIILTLVDTAIRLGELTGLTESDIDLENGYLMVMGKGQRQRLVPIGTKVSKALLKYKLRHRAEPQPGVDSFWLTKDGNPLTQWRVEEIVGHYGKKAGLERCYPHKLRHTSSVLYLRNGGDPFSLQKKLGHSSLAMTRHYCNLADADVKAKHMKFGVADRLKL